MFDVSPVILTGGMEIDGNIHSPKFFHSSKIDSWLCELYTLLMGIYGVSRKNAEKFSTIENWQDYIIAGYSPEEALEEDSEYWDLGGDSPHPYNFDEHWSAN